ncbi:phytoene/squalene synthase family protein [Metabacillus idriensis]|uniref:Phytoene/squalene synthase family protein n=1 Tax=Metabacillus idriensis TaxID=324768 RepID=A0A6I2M445_9BACI|nr:phytoene/squalene synthase family protein [Metabacillus idriensis]MCM3595097.1 phytoene/squalene synthase family protein [Metabacillus idriensis]MRX52875.1 phytoene/squalene synthase family protein [Metabacillus idriensis]OHR65502.1 phytoene synthase [Bacillus sp. HMSC76G11]
MSETANLHSDARDMLMATSRTFFIPISLLSPGLRETVTSAYLCMRAIDEIEDHQELHAETKSNLLRSISQLLQKPFNNNELIEILHPYKSLLPDVTLRLGDWIKLCPPTIAENILNATSTMAKGMADWVLKEWRIKDEEDLDQYTFYVAGLVGVMLSDIWKWHDATESDKSLAIAFGRGLQSVNILRNRSEDLERGVDFFPDGWELEDMFNYARRNLALADIYLEKINPGPILNFCKIPIALAHGTLDALIEGKEKMSRTAVTEIVSQVVSKQ